MAHSSKYFIGFKLLRLPLIQKCFEQGKSNGESPNQLTVPPVTPPILGKHGLQYFESLIHSAMSQVASEDCSNSAQHATSFYTATIIVGT